MRPIPFSDLFASEDGGIWSKCANGSFVEVRQQLMATGYMRVRLQWGRISHVVTVHRVILLTFVGSPTNGNVTRHLNGRRTDNRLCNLAWGTHAENSKDMVAHGTALTSEERSEQTKRAWRNHPEKHARGKRYAEAIMRGRLASPTGVARGERCQAAKLTARSVAEIRVKAASGVSHRDLAAAYGVTKENIGFVVRRETWKHVE